VSRGVVLLTGATGFVGRQVLRALAAQGVGVRLVVRAQSQARLEHADQAESVLVTQDLFAESADWWAQACAGVDTVIHAAWYAEPGLYLQSSKNIDCLIGTLQLAKGAAQAGVRRFVGVGTCFEYDLTPGHLSIGTPLKPLTPYAGAKAAAYLTLAQVLPLQQVEFAWCRLFYLFGEGEDARRFVPYLRSRLSTEQVAELTTGEQIRDYLDVREAGQAIADCALGTLQGPVNVCSGQGMQIRELAERIADEYGRRDLLKFGARPSNLVDPPCVVGVPGA
jgi:nucleoside-diphosphate-sugar epimerase